jgi:hypothetical protein
VPNGHATGESCALEANIRGGGKTVSVVFKYLSRRLHAWKVVGADRVTFKDDITVILLFGVSILVVPLAYTQLNAKGNIKFLTARKINLFIRGYRELTTLGFQFGNLCILHFSRKAFKI